MEPVAIINRLKAEFPDEVLDHLYFANAMRLLGLVPAQR